MVDCNENLGKDQNINHSKHELSNEKGEKLIEVAVENNVYIFKPKEIQRNTDYT